MNKDDIINYVLGIVLSLIAIAIGIWLCIVDKTIDSIIMKTIIWIVIAFFVYAFMSYPKSEKEKRAKLEEERKQKELEEELENQKKEEQRLKTLQEMEKKKKKREMFKIENKKEYERLNSLCKDIHNEYKDLLKEYSELDIDYDQSKMQNILKECYRKLEVIQEYQENYDCYSQLYVLGEMDKVKNKAKTFINKYIKLQKENGYDNDTIDVMQFYDDLWFIYDYIDEKYEKLNK